MDLWNMICRRHLLKLVPLNVPGNLDMVIAKMQGTELYTVITKLDLERTWFEVRGSAILGGSVGSRFGFRGQS